MPRVLPIRPNLDHLKRQAKDLLKAFASGDRAARQLFEQHLPSKLLHSRSNQPYCQVVLADALLVIAREYGFDSWTKLKQHVEVAAATQPTSTAATEEPDSRQARKLARQQHIQEMAERLIAAARQQQIEQVFSALFAPSRDMLAVRAYLVKHNAYDTVIEALLTGVDHPNARVRFLTAQAMDHFADQRCAEPLRRLLGDPVPRVRWAAIHALSCEACKLIPLTVGGDLVTSLIALALHDPSIKVRRVATYELGRACHDRRAMGALETILTQSTDRTVLRHARHALGRRRQSGSSCNSYASVSGDR